MSFEAFQRHSIRLGLTILFTVVSQFTFAAGVVRACKEIIEFRSLYGIEYLAHVKDSGEEGLRQLIEARKIDFEKKRLAHPSESELRESAQFKLETDKNWPTSLNRAEASAFYGKKTQENFIADVVVRKINEHVGSGVFAKSKILKGEMIGEYTGILKRSQPGESSDYLFSIPYYYPYHIDAKTAGNVTRFINHSEQNFNLQPTYIFQGGRWHIVFVSVRDILPGEQLLFNYGRSYWSDRGIPEELSGTK